MTPEAIRSIDQVLMEGSIVLLCIAEILQCCFRDVPAVELISIALKSIAWI